MLASFKQKDAITKAQEGAAFKERFRLLEKQHMEEREASQEDFKNYKVALITKE